MNASLALGIRRGLACVAGFTLAASAAAQTTYHVNGTCGDDSWSGLGPVCQAPDGPKRTIFAGMNLASTGDTVLVADGTYTGEGNKGLSFPGGSNFTLRSESGAQNCTIDLEGSGVAFFLVVDETPEAVIQGFTIQNGNSSMGGAFYLHHSSRVTIADCVIRDNWSSSSGGAILADTEVSPTIVNCRFEGNAAGSTGGAIAFFNDSSAPTLVNCEIVGNAAGADGGGIYLSGDDTVTLINTTIAGNVAGGSGGALFNAGFSDLQVMNSILWDNGPVPIDGPGGATVSFSDVQGGWPGAGNLDADPRFAGTTLQLRAGSPCVDRGDDGALPPGVLTDFLGRPRVRDGDGDGIPRVDMGAHERTGTRVRAPRGPVQR